jgi:myo-inositol 2-dehydrogenase/D-chiro-inositol 1-dehydrogenase
VEVFGPNGMVMNHNDTINNVEICTDNMISRDKIPYFFLERYKDSYVSEMREFCECIQKNKIPTVSGIDGFQAVVIAKAALLSLKENRPVKTSEILQS